MDAVSDYKKVKVISVRGLNTQVRAIRFEFIDPSDKKSFSFYPGSFIMVGIPGFGESPLTITTSLAELPQFEVAVRSVGNTTKTLNRLSVGDTAYIRGPLGKEIDFAEIFGRELVLIAGGIGLAPLRSVIKNIENNPETISKLAIVYGAKNPEEMIFKEDLAKWSKVFDLQLIVDRADADWDGAIGRIPTLVKKLQLPNDASAIICGPPVMYDSIVQALLELKLSKQNIHLMLERKMVCGTGKCQHCTCGGKYVCTDGPTFTYAELEDNWEALIK